MVIFKHDKFSVVKDGRTTTLRGCSAVTDEARYKCEEHMTSTTVRDADEEEEDDNDNIAVAGEDDDVTDKARYKCKILNRGYFLLAEK